MGDIVDGTCPNCYGTKLIVHLDELSCVNCGHRIEGHLSQLNLVEENDNFSGFKQSASQSQSYSQLQNHQQVKNERYDAEDGASNENRLNKLFSRKRQRQQRLEKSDVNYVNYLEAMQFILGKQTDSLISKCGVTKNIKDTVFQLWFKYVKLCIAENMDFENIFLYNRYRKRETRLKNVWQKWKEELQQQHQDRPIFDDNDDDYEMDISGDDENDSDSSIVSDDSNDRYDNDGVDDGSTNTSSSSSSISFEPPKPELMITLAILYIACLHWRETITVQDLETWADNGTLPYWFVYDTLMPPSMQYLLKDAKVFFRGTGRAYRHGKSRWYYFYDHKKRNAEDRYWFENRKITVLSSRLAISLGQKLSKINISSLTLRLSFSIGIPSSIAKISAMAAGILSNLDHWTIVKRNVSGRNNSIVSHRRSYMTLVCLLILSLELFYKKWYTFVLYHLPLKVENSIGHLLNKGIPDEVIHRNKSSSSSSNNNGSQRNQTTIHPTTVSVSSSSSSTTTSTTTTTRRKRNINQQALKKNTFLPHQTSTKIPWTLEETSRLPNCSLLSYLNFCTNQFKSKENYRNRNSSTIQNSNQNPFDRFSKHFESNYVFAKKFNAYDVKHVSPSDLKKNVSLKSTSYKTIAKINSFAKILNGQKELAKKRLFYHVGSFIGEDENAIEHMYNRMSMDDIVFKTLLACRSNLYI